MNIVASDGIVFEKSSNSNIGNSDDVLYTSPNEDDIRVPSESEIESDASFYTLPIEEFGLVKHPLDALEHVYTSMFCISEFYGFNDLKDQEPFTCFELTSKSELEKIDSSLKLINSTLILTLVKMFLCPFSILFDICGCLAIKKLDPDQIVVYNFIIFGSILTRITAGSFILTDMSGFYSRLFGVWIIAGAILEIPQLILNYKTQKIVNDFNSDQLKCLKLKSTNSALLVRV